MLAAVRDAVAADTYSALLPTRDDTVPSKEVSTQHQPMQTTHDQPQQQQQPPQHQIQQHGRRRREMPRPVSVASIDLRDPDEK